MQSASLLMLIGGLRGVATRLTLWLALLGASLATANGKHINIDVVMRFLTPRDAGACRRCTGWIAAAVMCIAGAWGFFDHITIALFHVQPGSQTCAAGAKAPNKSGHLRDVPASEKIEPRASTRWARILFVIRAADERSTCAAFPRVVTGTKYNGYLTRRRVEHVGERKGDWGSHFPAEQVAGPPQRRPTSPQEFHIPAVSIPGGQEVRGLLIKDADLVFPFGLLMIALRLHPAVAPGALGPRRRRSGLRAQAKRTSTRMACAPTASRRTRCVEGEA